MPRISAIAYRVDRLAGWAEQETKLGKLLDGCDLALLPEYAGLEAAIMSAPASGTPTDWRDRAVERADDWAAQLAHLARKHRCWIAGATIPAKADHGIVNRGFLVAPWGEVHHQDKLMLTPYERDVLGMVPGNGLTVVDTVLGRFGMLICYDSEFPILARGLAEAEVDMILVPSCTDAPAGQTRVRQSARARAIENQCLVVQAPLVGEVPFCDIIDASTGQSGFFVPPDHGLPGDGILRDGMADRPGAVTCDVDFAAISGSRHSGQVDNFARWPAQFAGNTTVRILEL